MKKLRLLMIFVTSALIFIACENGDSIDETASISEDDTIALVEADDIADEIDNVVDDILAEDFGIAGKEEASKSGDAKWYGRPECLTKTIVWRGDSKSVTLDFGDGCELPNGHILSGQIEMSYIFDLNANSITIAREFKDFFFNDVAVEGVNTIVKTWKNYKGNIQSEKTIDVTLIWPDGHTATRNGTRTREWLEGKETKTWGDNVFLISGNVTTTFKNGIVFTSKIIEPLRREMACRFILSGTVEISKGDRQGTLDYGNGTCDNKATFTNMEKKVKEITLRKRKP